MIAHAPSPSMYSGPAQYMLTLPLYPHADYDIVTTFGLIDGQHLLISTYVVAIEFRLTSCTHIL